MPSPPDGTFPHQRLDAYHVALQMAVDARRLAAKLPRGDRNLRDQLERAATSAVLNLAEGANRWRRADKSARFAVARGECGEVAAAAELAAALGLATTEDANVVRGLAARVAAMLTRLMTRLG